MVYNSNKLIASVGPDNSDFPSVRINPNLKPAIEKESTTDRVFGSRLETIKPSIRLKTQMDINPGN